MVRRQPAVTGTPRAVSDCASVSGLSTAEYVVSSGAPLTGHPAAGGGQMTYQPMQGGAMMRPQVALQQGRPAPHDPGLHPGGWPAGNRRGEGEGQTWRNMLEGGRTSVDESVSYLLIE